MRRWMIESLVYFLIGLGIIAAAWWQLGEALEGSRFVLATSFIAAAAILIPARTQIARIRRERRQAERNNIDTFR